MVIGIRGKLLLLFGGIIFIVLGLHTYLQLNAQRTAFEGELKKRTQLMQENLYQRALSSAESLRRVATEDIASYNFFSLANTIQAATFNSTELDYVVLVDVANKVYIDTETPDNQQSLYTPKEVTADTKSQTKVHEGVLRTLYFDENETSYLMEYELPVSIGPTPWGKMLFGFSLLHLNEQIAASLKENEANLQKLSIQTGYIAAVILLLTYLLISHLSQRIVSPIIELRRHTKELAEGKFENADKIESESADEVGMLTRDFGLMAGNLAHSYRQLEEYNLTLEQKVSERTEALNFKNDELLKALENLEESQQQLIHSEKMAALGQLIAGIAHEINTPLGAIQASIGNSSRYLNAFSENLHTFLRSTNTEEQLFLCNLLTKARHEKRFSTREERKIRRNLVEIFEHEEILKAEDLAEMLVDMELSDEIDHLLPFFKQPNSYYITEMAHKLTGIGRNSETIRTAVGRASKVVFALKHFAHHDNSGNKISSDINQGIRTVLTLYQNLLKQGCEVIEQFGDIPEISCYPDELNQVWTNLIHNAIYAMKNKGTLTITTEKTGGEIKVTFADSGSGIPEDVQPHIFDSFYTTKPAGEGSGLGLGICKRIIDKHDGEITFVSAPGNTVFTVTLPII